MRNHPVRSRVSEAGRSSLWMRSFGFIGIDGWMQIGGKCPKFMEYMFRSENELEQ